MTKVWYSAEQGKLDRDFRNELIDIEEFTRSSKLLKRRLREVEAEHSLPTQRNPKTEDYEDG